MTMKMYAHHRPTEAALGRIKLIRSAFSALHQHIDELLPTPSREKSIAITNLEQAAMWTIKAVVCNDPDSVVETP